MQAGERYFASQSTVTSGGEVLYLGSQSTVFRVPK